MMIDKGLPIHSLFGAHGFRTECFKDDWLHAVDLGVAPDVIGNLFWMLLDRMDGDDQEARRKALFLEIKKYYKKNPGLPGHLDHLTITMIKRDRNAPKLKSYGAETRGLIGFLPVAAKQMA